MAIANEITRLQTAKSDIKTAIEGKWVTVPDATKLDWYSALIDQISVRGSRMSHLVTPTATFISYYTPYSYSTPISWEYNWTAYGVSSYYYYTGSDSFRDYEGILACKITPTTWIAWATMRQRETSSSHQQNRGDTPVRWSVWRNADSSTVKVFIFLNQVPSSSYPHLSTTFCFAYTWDTNTGSVSGNPEVRWTLYDYDPTNYWYDLTWYTEVTDSSWISSTNLSRSWTTVSYSFNIKD